MKTRFGACVVLFAASALVVAERTEVVSAQGKDNKNVNQLEKQLKAAQADLLQAQRQIAALRQDVVQLNAANNKLEAALKKDAKNDEKNLKALREKIDAYRGAGLVHVVVLKAKADTAPADVQALIDDSYSQLTRIKTVRALWAGKPDAKATPDAATDYTVALVLLFDDAGDLKAYLNEPAHTKFADRHLKKWETPLVYDFEPRRAKP
jgi:TolA-binding protein